MECCLPAQAGNIGKEHVLLIPFFHNSNIPTSFAYLDRGNFALVGLRRSSARIYKIFY